MIFYFSGTGNSKYLAEIIASVTKDSIISLNDKIREGDNSSIDAGENLVFAVPTYAWRIPKVVDKWIRQTDFVNAKKAWFVMTCGGEIGNAEKYNRLLCEYKQLEYMGTKGFVMPENYIAMFDAPDDVRAKEIIAKAKPLMEETALNIKNSEQFSKPRCNSYDRIMSSMVNKMFYSMFVKADKFYAKDSCINCGKCEELCPLNNISMKDKKPEWGKNCTHCMACICHCPTEAIEYGKKSEGKPRYHCD